MPVCAREGCSIEFSLRSTSGRLVLNKKYCSYPCLRLARHPTAIPLEDVGKIIKCANPNCNNTFKLGRGKGAKDRIFCLDPCNRQRKNKLKWASMTPEDKLRQQESINRWILSPKGKFNVLKQNAKKGHRVLDFDMEYYEANLYDKP